MSDDDKLKLATERARACRLDNIREDIWGLYRNAAEYCDVHPDGDRTHQEIIQMMAFTASMMQRIASAHDVAKHAVILLEQKLDAEAKAVVTPEERHLQIAPAPVEVPDGE